LLQLSYGRIHEAEVDKPHDRRPEVRAAVEGAGCTVTEYYFALGPVHVIVINEAPGAIINAPVSMILGALAAAVDHDSNAG
jgi:uncharacterized protein with GYD domain